MSYQKTPAHDYCAGVFEEGKYSVKAVLGTFLSYFRLKVILNIFRLLPVLRGLISELVLLGIWYQSRILTLPGSLFRIRQVPVFLRIYFVFYSQQLNKTDIVCPVIISFAKQK